MLSTFLNFAKSLGKNTNGSKHTINESHIIRLDLIANHADKVIGNKWRVKLGYPATVLILIYNEIARSLDEVNAVNHIPAGGFYSISSWVHFG